MRTIFVLVRKDFANFTRNKAAVALTFIVPFALIWLFGQIFGVNRTDSGPTGIPLAVVNASDNPAATRLIAALQSEKTFKVFTKFVAADKSERPLREEDLAPKMRANDFRFAVVIPADLFSEAKLGLHLKIYHNPRNEIETQLVNGILQKTIFANVPQLLGQAVMARGRGVVGGERLDRFNHAVADNVARTFGGDPEQIAKRMQQGDFGPALLGDGKGAGFGNAK